MDKDLLHLKIIREILSQISVGVYKHGRRLPAERTLCQQFGVSRGTLRRALSDLEKMGVLQIKPQSGAYVRKIPESGFGAKNLPTNIVHLNLQDVIFARKAIELAAIELACLRMTGGELNGLETCIEGMQKNIDNLPEYLRFDIAFHEQIVRAGKNAALITAFDSISGYHKYSQVFSSSSETCEVDAIQHHRRILTALTEGDTQRSISALRRHFDSIMKGQTQ